MKRINSIIWGLVLLAISAVLILNAFGLTSMPICLIISVVAVLAAAEELFIHISAGEYNADRKALFADVFYRQ